jgi:hypothetical protein
MDLDLHLDLPHVLMPGVALLLTTVRPVKGGTPRTRGRPVVQRPAGTWGVLAEPG